jgi:light-regulated signal transduction histidine kinase (bacteriophytochrome)
MEVVPQGCPNITFVQTTQRTGYGSAAFATPFQDAILMKSQRSYVATTKAQGLGIGLSLSRTIIEAHGGQLTTGGDAQGTHD